MKLGPFTLNTIQRRCIAKLKTLQEGEDKPQVDLGNSQHISALLRESCASDQRLVLDYAELFALASIGDIRQYLSSLHIDLDQPSLRKAEISRAMKSAKRQEPTALQTDAISTQHKLNSERALRRRMAY